MQVKTLYEVSICPIEMSIAAGAGEKRIVPDLRDSPKSDNFRVKEK